MVIGIAGRGDEEESVVAAPQLTEWISIGMQSLVLIDPRAICFPLDTMIGITGAEKGEEKDDDHWGG